jgi:hypothetical protein
MRPIREHRRAVGAFSARPLHHAPAPDPVCREARPQNAARSAGKARHSCEPPAVQVASAAACAAALRLARQPPSSTSAPGTKIIAQMNLSRWVLTNGMLPNR